MHIYEVCLNQIQEHGQIYLIQLAGERVLKQQRLVVLPTGSVLCLRIIITKYFSFYEYIVKYYILSGQTDAKQLDWWKDIRTGLKKSLVKRNTIDKEMPVMMIELSSSGRQINKMGHLGMFDTKNPNPVFPILFLKLSCELQLGRRGDGELNIMHISYSCSLHI